MPRHPRIALTSRLRVHTTNDITGCPFGSPTRQSSARWPLSGADDYNLSQIISYDDVDIWNLELPVQIALHRSALRTAEAILVSKIEHLTASILKNPFTMSNTGRLDPITVLSHGEPFLFISRLWLKVRVSRARQSQLSCALWGTHQSNTLMGPSCALCGAGRSCRRARQLCCLVSYPAKWWSLSGSNR